MTRLLKFMLTLMCLFALSLPASLVGATPDVSDALAQDIDLLDDADVDVLGEDDDDDDDDDFEEVEDDDDDDD